MINMLCFDKEKAEAPLNHQLVLRNKTAMNDQFGAVISLC